MESILKIPIIEDHVHLGCTAEERTFKQRVHYSVEFHFAVLPSACETDSMDQTPCYAEISKHLTAVSAEKHFSTIEHLAHQGFLSIEKYIRSFDKLKTTQILLSVHKLHPPVTEIKNGAFFSICKK